MPGVLSEQWKDAVAMNCDVKDYDKSSLEKDEAKSLIWPC